MNRERLNEIDRQPPWELTQEWVERRIRLTQAYLDSFKCGYAPNRVPCVSLPGNQLLALLARVAGQKDDYKSTTTRLTCCAKTSL